MEINETATQYTDGLESSIVPCFMFYVLCVLHGKMFALNDSNEKENVAKVYI